MVMDMTLGKEYNFNRKSKESVLGRRKGMRKKTTQIVSVWHIEEWRIKNDMPAWHCAKYFSKSALNVH